MNAKPSISSGRYGRSTLGNSVRAIHGPARCSGSRIATFTIRMPRIIVEQ